MRVGQIALDVTDATRTYFAFVSSSPIFPLLEWSFLFSRLRPLPSTVRSARNAFNTLPNLTYIYLLPTHAILALSHLASKEPTMEWTAPKHEEIDLNCEISSYANAEL
jgi:hypothetical protein